MTMIQHWIRRSAPGLAAVGLGLFIFILTLMALQHPAQAAMLSQPSAGPASPSASPVEVTITKTNGLTEVLPGMSVVYTITARNLSTTTLTNAEVVDSLPAAYFPLSVSAGGTNLSDLSIPPFVNGQPVRVIATMGAGAILQVTLTGTVNANATGTLTNTAVISLPAGVIDTNPANNTAVDADPIRANPPITPASQLQISKTDGVTAVVTGQVLTYTVIVTNPTPALITGIHITDTLPADFALKGAQIQITNDITPAIAIAGNNTLITATVGLGPSDVATLFISGTVGFVPAASIINTAAVAAPGMPVLTATDVDAFTPFLALTQKTYLPLIFKS